MILSYWKHFSSQCERIGLIYCQGKTMIGLGSNENWIHPHIINTLRGVLPIDIMLLNYGICSFQLWGKGGLDANEYLWQIQFWVGCPKKGLYCKAQTKVAGSGGGGGGGGLLACIGKWCELEHPLTAFTRPVREGWRWLFFAKKKCLKWTIWWNTFCENP